MKKGRIILLALLVLILVGGVTAYVIWNKPHTKVEDVEAMQVSVAELTGAYESDEAKANNTYLNKALKVTGTISETEINQDGKLMVILAGDDEGGNTVQCTMRDRKENLETGKTITVKGFCTGSSLFGVLMTDCVVVNK